MPYTFLRGQCAPASFIRVSTGLLAGVSRVSPSFPFAGSFAGSFPPVFHNLLMPKHQNWSHLSDSHRITAASRRLQTPSNSTVYARSPVKSGFQRSLQKSRTLLPIALQNSPTNLPVSFYWRSPFVSIIIGYMSWSIFR